VAARGPEVLIGGAPWRAAAERAQEQVLPAGTVTVTCSAPVGGGGLGRHLEELLGAFARRGQSPACICEGQPGSEPPRSGPVRRALRPLGRISPAWRLRRVSIAFDEDAARRLPPAEHLIGFNGTSLAQFRRARAGGAGSLGLVSATAHARRLRERHRAARSRYPIERSWATGVVRRNLREYALADRIYVSSDYVRESFLEHGVEERALATFPLTPAPRFDPSERSAADAFEVVYVGGFTVDKGVPLLIDAVRRLPHTDLRLRLVGGWKTPGMRRFVSEAMAADARIEVLVGDPLPHLRSASLYVHPAYCDGFAYAPAEAMACGVPVLVSADTGMKELISPGENGLVLPTGDLEALSDAIDAAYRGEILSS
jgi:glycosyltransferase involved in cell wall biosynthesis